MKSFDADQTRAALPFERLVPALERAFASGAEVPPRHVHALAGGTVLIMPAWQGRFLGIKTINIFPGNAARGLPGLFATYLLYDATTGEPLAQIDGNEITARRTAAASALAAAKLVRPEARRLLVLGRGRVGSLLPEAYRSVLPIENVTVWHRGCGLALEDAVRQADIVSCATLSEAPLVRGEWLRPGSHLDLIGSFTPRMREADDACFAGAAIYLDTEEALAKSGDLIGPMARGVFTPADVRGTLSTLCRGTAPHPRHAGERTVFKSVGTALEDLAAAMLVFGSADD
jgi:ornithine cyclodeaminase/alanine dehydrogenase-like protein (mu-crystallin family)